MPFGQAEPIAPSPHPLNPCVGCRHHLPSLGCIPRAALQHRMPHRAGAAPRQGPPGTLSVSPSLPAALPEGGLHQRSTEAAPAPSQPSLLGTAGLWVSESPDQNQLLPTTPAAISLPFPAGVPSRSLPRPSHVSTGSTLPGWPCQAGGLWASRRSCESPAAIPVPVTQLFPHRPSQTPRVSRATLSTSLSRCGPEL